MAAQYLALDSFWVDKSKYDDAERAYYESQRNESLTPLADEVARARQRLNEIRGNFADEVKAVTAEAPSIVQPAKTGEPGCSMASVDVGAIKFLEKKITDFEKVIDDIQKQFSLVVTRLSNIEAALPNVCPAKSGACQKPAAAVCQKPAAAPAKQEDDDDDVDLFGSESEDEEAVTKLKEERLAAYNAKKSKKPALIAKSSIILDVKPWDDETDMKLLEAGVRKIEMDGLLWGASKLVPLAYGIHKLQINCVVEDEKVSVDLLQEQIEAIEDFVQSVDIAAFNKI